MPRAELERTSQVSLSGVSIDITDPLAESAGFVILNTTGEISIPAGAYKVFIYSAGFLLPGDDNVLATVNGQDWPPQLPIEIRAELDPTTNRYKRLPAITINNIIIQTPLI